MKYIFAFITCFIFCVPFFVFVVTKPHIYQSLLTSFVFSVLGGLLGAIFPSNKKHIYLPMSVFLLFLLFFHVVRSVDLSWI